MTKFPVISLMMMGVLLAEARIQYTWKDCPYNRLGEQGSYLPQTENDWKTYLPKLGKLRLVLRDPFNEELRYSPSFITLQFPTDSTWTITHYTMGGESKSMTGPISKIHKQDQEWMVTLGNVKQHGATANIFTIDDVTTIQFVFTTVDDNFVIAKATQKSGWNCYESRYVFLRPATSLDDFDFECVMETMIPKYKLPSMSYAGVFSEC